MKVLLTHLCRSASLLEARGYGGREEGRRRRLGSTPRPGATAPVCMAPYFVGLRKGCQSFLTVFTPFCQGGHFAAVAGCCWSMDGACLLSVGEDQTARIFTAVSQQRLPDRDHGRPGSGRPPAGRHWCELARPQIHGHDFTCVASVPGPASTTPGPASPYLFISGSEEKMLRAFEAPQVWKRGVEARCGYLVWEREEGRAKCGRNRT